MVFRIFTVLLSLLLNFAVCSPCLAQPDERLEPDPHAKPQCDLVELKSILCDSLNLMMKSAGQQKQEQVNRLAELSRGVCEYAGINQAHINSRIELAKAILSLGKEDKVLGLFRSLYWTLLFALSNDLEARDKNLSNAYCKADKLGLSIEHLNGIRWLLIFRESDHLRSSFFVEIENLLEMTSSKDLKQRVTIRKLNRAMKEYAFEFETALSIPQNLSTSKR